MYTLMLQSAILYSHVNNMRYATYVHACAALIILETP